MPIIQYGFFGEDEAQREFLAAYLKCFETPDGELRFVAVEYFGKKFGPMNNKVVDRRCADACLEAFVLGYPVLDWLFIGRDVDSFEQERYTELLQQFRVRIPQEWHDRILFMLPVQCAEHWLLYLASHPSRNPLERKPKEQAKELVYADKSRSKVEIRRALLSSFDSEHIEWLTEISTSFQAFHEQFRQYLFAMPVGDE